MTVKRSLLSVLLIALLLLSALPAAQAQRACADALTRCAAGCSDRFGGGFFGAIMVGGCTDGCNIGYLWCAASN